jgi:tetratricopeptide (TPR) repeat protein
MLFATMLSRQVCVEGARRRAGIRPCADGPATPFAEVEQGDVDLWLRMGSLSQSAGHYRAARFAFERGLECHAGNWDCLERLATVLEALGDLRGCQRAVQAALSVDPSHAGMRARLARLRRPDPEAPNSEPSRRGDADTDADADADADADMMPVAPPELRVMLTADNRRTAWVALAEALLKAGECAGMQGGVELAVDDQGRLAGGQRAYMTKRVTEEDRQREQGLSQRALPQVSSDDVESNEEVQSEVASVSATSQSEDVPKRRVSSRQMERREAREERQLEETRSVKEKARLWLSENFGGVRGDRDGTANVPQVTWRERSRAQDSQGGAGTQEDEGSKLARELLAPFKGRHSSKCHVCGIGGSLLCCETCSTVYHPACLFKAPGLTQDLYCDECKEEAFARANRTPVQVSDGALADTQVCDIVNGFVPATAGAMGLPDMMHRLVIRLGDVQDGRVWRDGALRRVALQLEAASRPFARDLQLHSCSDPHIRYFDFGPGGELFLAELKLEEALEAGRKEVPLLGDFFETVGADPSSCLGGGGDPKPEFVHISWSGAGLRGQDRRGRRWRLRGEEGR